MGFDRDQLVPNYQYKPEDFYRLLAHITLEDCYAANGAKLLRWQTDDDVAVPPPATLRSCAREYEVEELEAKFVRATCRLLEREELLPEEPVHLAYDITDAPGTATTPVKNEDEIADALRRLIRRVSTYADFELGHV